MKQIKVIIIVLIGIVGIIKIFFSHQNQKDKTKILPEIGFVLKRNIEREVIMSYQVEPENCVEYMIPSNSELRYFNKNKTLYKKGDLVFQVIRPEESLKLLIQKLNVKEASKKFELSKKMLTAGLINLEKYYADSYNLEMQLLKFKKMEEKIENLKFIAPFNGYIDSKITLNNEVRLHAPLTLKFCSQKSIIKVWIPQSVIGFFDSVGEKQDFYYISILTPLNIGFTSQVIHIALKGIEKDGENVFEGIFNIPDTTLNIKQGMTGELSLSIRSKNSLLSIPLAAVRGIDKPYVFFLKNGIAIKKYVHLGLIGDEFVEIKDTALPSDTVIVGPPSIFNLLKDNSNVHYKSN